MRGTAADRPLRCGRGSMGAHCGGADGRGAYAAGGPDAWHGPVRGRAARRGTSGVSG